MFQHQGIWLPDGERHFPDWMTKNGEIVDGRGTYQIRKWRACLPWIKNWRVAVDCGAHVGFWSLQMMKRFESVQAFEPMAAYRECFERNTESFTKDGVTRWFAALHPIALGAAPGRVAMKVPSLGGGIDSGGTHVAMDHGQIVGGGDIEMRTLDSFDFQNVDFVKIDVEGAEQEVVMGAAETLKRCRPCMIIEQKPHKLAQNFGRAGTPAVDFIQSLGAKVRKAISGDYICSWD